MRIPAIISLLLLLLPTLVRAAGDSPVSRSAEQPRLAVLRDAIDGLDPTLVEHFAAGLQQAGVPTEFVSCRQLADAEQFQRKRYDSLALVYSPAFPAVAAANLRAFLRTGGHLVLMGGPAFSQPVFAHHGRWLAWPKLSAALLGAPRDARPLLDLESDGAAAWKRGASKMSAASRLTLDTGRVGKALRLELKQVEWYDVYAAALKTPPPAEHTALTLWARADPATPQIFVEITERDGCRWSRAVDVGVEWRACLLPAVSFLFKKDGAPAGRGGKGDRLHLERAARITLGMARDRVPTAQGDHTFWVGELATLAVDLPQDARDGFRFDINEAFDDYEVYHLRDVVRAKLHPQAEGFPATFDRPGAWSGLSAIGFSYPQESAFLPLVTAFDRHDRRRGWAGGALIHFDGRYKGSQWALFGVAEPAFYDHPDFTRLAAQIVAQFRSGRWIEETRRANDASTARTCALRTPAPPPLRIANAHFVDGRGQRFFLIGANLYCSFDRGYGAWDVNCLERDFQRMQAAGINALRIMNFGRFARVATPERLPALLEMARKYRVYLLAELGGYGPQLPDKAALQAEMRRIAGLLKDEPIILGYDLKNEPYWHEVARLREQDRTLGERFPDAQGWKEFQRGLKVAPADWTSTFPGLQGPLVRPEDAVQRRAFDSVCGIYGTWINWQIEALRSVDQTHPITVGYNTVFDCLPINKPLDFVSHHCYEPPDSLEHVLANVTTLDRLKAAWPDRPITLGEFGYSSGALIRGQYLDVDSQAVGEMLHYLYALTHGYDGVMKWQVCDWAPPNQQREATWMRDTSAAHRIYESRFGFYYADGTPEGGPKPIVFATRFLHDYLATGAAGGTLEVRPAATLIGAGYVYRNRGALFVGDTRYESAELSFKTPRAVNVMLAGNVKQLRLMATSDVTVRVDPAALGTALDRASVRVHGARGAVQRLGKHLQIELLCGEIVTLE